jgi:O-antigen/teichoic acid export membrane protein
MTAGLRRSRELMSNEELSTAVGLETASLVSPAVSSPRFASRVGWTFATRLSMVAGGVGSSIIVARWLGARGLGQLSVVNVTVGLALQIASAGLPSAMTYFVAKDRKHLAAAASSALLFAVVAGGAAALAIAGLSFASPALFGDLPTNLLTIAAISLPFLLVTLLGYHLLLAIEKVAQFNVLDGAAPLLVLVNTAVALVVLHSGLITLVAFNTAATGLISIAMIVTVVRSVKQESEGPRWRPDLSLFKGTIGYGMKFYISIIAGVIIIRADLLIVNHFRGEAEAGVYAVASQVAALLMLLPAVIAMLLFPRVASDPDPRGEFALRVTRNASFLMLLICVAAGALSFVLPLVYGARFADSTIQLLILLPGVYLISIESVLVQHFTGTGLPVAIPFFWLGTLALSLGLNLAFVPAFGARAAAVISTICYALIFFLVAVYFCMKTGRRPSEMLWLRRGELLDLIARARSLVPATKAQQ